MPGMRTERSPPHPSFHVGHLAFGQGHSPAPPPGGHSDQRTELRGAASEMTLPVETDLVWGLKLPTTHPGWGPAAWRGGGGILMEEEGLEKKWALEPTLGSSALKTQPLEHRIPAPFPQPWASSPCSRADNGNKHVLKPVIAFISFQEGLGRALLPPSGSLASSCSRIRLNLDVLSRQSLQLDQ